MAYIGVQPADAYTSFSVQHFTTSATDTFTLDFPVANENEIALFINNVRQEPGSSYAYTASGTTLTLSSAITGSDSMYCVFIGKAVQTVTPAVGSVTNDMLSGSIATSKLANQNIGFRNLIINGDMSIAQRGTSVSGLTNGSSQYLIDRFKWYEGGSPTYQFTMSQDTDVPTGQGLAKSLKLDCTTAQGSLGAGDQNILWQRIEGQNLQQLKFGTSNAESLILSFWVKSSKTGTYIVELYQPDGNRGISKAYTINESNTWEKKTITYAGDTSGTINNDNGAGLDVYFFLSAGSNYQSGTLATSWQGYSAGDECVGQVNLADSTDNNWWITGVQLEADTSASDFEFIPKDINLQRCMRYYQIYSYMGAPGSEVGFSLPIRQSSAGNRQWMITTTLLIPIRSFSPTMSWDAARTGNASNAYDGSWLYETGSAGNKWIAPTNFFTYANYGGSPVSSASYLSENLGTIASVITDNTNFTSGETVTFSSRLIVDAEL